MEKKEYVAPEMEIVDVELDNVVLASGDQPTVQGILNGWSEGDREDW